MRFKIKVTHPLGYAAPAYHFECPLCMYETLTNLNLEYVEDEAAEHLVEVHAVSVGYRRFKIQEAKKPKVKEPSPQTVVLVRHRTPQGNMLTSLVEPSSGEDPVTFARWAAKEFTTNTYTIHTFVTKKIEEISPRG